MRTHVHSDGRTHDFHSTELPLGKGGLSTDRASHAGYFTHLRYKALAIKEYECALYRRHALENVILIFFKVYSYSGSSLVERMVG